MSKQKSIRSPLGRARGLGSAHGAVHHWWMQRLSAIALTPACLYLVFRLNALLPESHAALTAEIAKPLTAFSLLIAIIAGFYHAALGVQIVVEDYVHDRHWKYPMLVINQIVFFFLGVGGAYALIVIALHAQG